MKAVCRKIWLRTSSTLLTNANLWAPGKQLILHGNPSAIAAIDFSPYMAVLRRHLFLTECASPVLHVASGHPRWRFGHLCSPRWIHCLSAPLENPFKTHLRESLSCGPIWFFQPPHLIRVSGRWLYSGRMIRDVSSQLISSWEGKEEMRSIIHLRQHCTFFDDPDVPFRPKPRRPFDQTRAPYPEPQDPPRSTR